MRLAWTLGLSAALAACAAPGHTPPAAQPWPASAAGLPDVSTTAVADSWWRHWNDPQLNQLMAQALQASPTLADVQARVRRMQALGGMVDANGWPQVSLGAELGRQRYSANGLYPPPIAGSTHSNNTVQLGMGWSLDLWGQHRAELASAVGQVRASQADAAVASNALAHQVIRGYVTLARWLALHDVAEGTVRQRKEMQQLVAQRREAGLDTRIEQAQSEGSLADAQAQVEALKEQITLARHQLAVLSGQAPQALDAWHPQLDALRLDPAPTTIGSDLLGRRPDVVAARWRVEAAEQDTRAARTQFYPNVNLNAFAGFNALGMNHLLDTGSRQYGLAPAVRLPLFDGGRLRAQLSGREAERDSAVAHYNSVVLHAAREATDAIASGQSVSHQWQAQTRALAQAQRAHALAQERQQAGLGNRLAVLSAESAVLAQRRLVIELHARQLDNRAELMRALGGGWTDAAAPDHAARTTAR